MNFITVRRHDGNCHATRKDTDDSSVAVDATFDRNPTPRRSYPLGLSCMSDEHRVLSPVVLQQSETPVFLLTHGGSHSLQRQPSLDPHSSQQQHMPLPLPIQYTPPPKFGQHMALLQGALLIQQLTQPRVEGTLGVHSLTRLSSQLSQSSQLGEDQVLLCQAPYQQEQPTDLMTKPIPAPSSLPEDGSSNAGYMVLATHKHDKGNGEYEDETGPEVQKKTKRPRNALQLQERLEIIDFREKNQHMSMYTISEKFGVPRSTIYGIIKDKDRLKKLTASGASNGLTLERKSSVESPFHLLEELLVAWSGDLGERGFVVTDKKTTAQAFEIHRMLYGIVSKPLPSCEFTLGWIQRFKKRRNWSTLAAREASDTIHQADSWSFPEDLLRRLPTGLDDVFMCGMVSMYLDVLPTRVYATSSQESETTIQDSPIASVLLCCNATGTSLRAPYVSGRGIHTDKIPQEYSRDKDVDAGMEDLTASELAKWLEDFDKELDRSIVLILDRSTWSLLQPKPEGHDGQDPLAALNARLKNIVISKVPKTHDAFHPMAAGLGQEFKLLYLCFLLGLDVDVDKRAMFREETTFVNRLSFIRHAWFSVRESIINRSFETVEASLRNWAGHHQLSLESSIWSKNAKVLPLSRGTIIDEDPRRHPLPRDRTNLIDNDLSREVRNAFPSAPDTVIQYYLTQEAEIGPSYFLRNKVREMQHHKDFEGCFRSDSDQARRFEAPAHPIYGKSRHDGGNNATGLDKDDTLTLEIHSCRNVASCLSESHGAALGAILSNLSSQIGNTVVADEMTHHNPPSTDSVGSQWTLPSSGEQQNSSTADLEHGNITSSEECREWDDELDALRAVLCPEVESTTSKRADCSPIDLPTGFRALCIAGGLMSGEHGETNQPLSGVMTSCPNPEPCVFGSSAQLCDTCQQVILRLIQQHNSSSQVDSIQNSLLPRTQPGAETVREQKPCHWAQTRSPVDAMSDQFSDPLAQGIAASANSRLNPASFPPGLFIPWHDSCQQDTVVSSNSSVPNQLSQFIPFPVDFAGSFAPVANTRLHTTHHRSYQQPSTPPSHTSPPPGTQNALAVDLQSQTQHSMHGQIRFLQTSHSRQLQAANQHAYQQQPQSHPQYQQHQQIQHTVQTSIYQALSQLQQQALTQLFNPMGDNLERSTPPGTTQQHSQSGQVLLSQSTRQENTNPPLTSEPVPSSLHERDYNRKQVKRRDRVQDGQPKAKRNRKNYTPEERLEIKKYRDKNPEKSFREIGDKFSLSKTSLHRILQKMTP